MPLSWLMLHHNYWNFYITKFTYMNVFCCVIMILFQCFHVEKWRKMQRTILCIFCTRIIFFWSWILLKIYWYQFMLFKVSLKINSMCCMKRDYHIYVFYWKWLCLPHITSHLSLHGSLMHGSINMRLSKICVLITLIISIQTKYLSRCISTRRLSLILC